MSDFTVLGATRVQSLIGAGYLLPSTRPSPLSFYNQTGPTQSGVNTVLDTVALSAQAREAINEGVSSFSDRTEGLRQIGNGSVDSFINRDYSGAIFFGQNLDGALFQNAVLKDVNFAATSLRGAVFISSLVDGAQFGQADISGADLSGAQGLTLAQIQNATFDDSAIFPAGIGNDILISLPFGRGGRA